MGRRLEALHQMLATAGARRGPRADGRLQRHAGLVQRRRALPRARRRPSRGSTSCSQRGPTSSTSAASRRGRARRPVAGARAARARARRGDGARSLAGPASRSTPPSPEVAAACLDAGACAVNDVSCLRDDRLARVVAGSGAALVLMHARGHAGATWPASASTPTTPTATSSPTCCAEWEARRGAGAGAGLPRDALVMDPGLGLRQERAAQPRAARARTRELVAAGRRARRRRREPQVVPRRRGRPRRTPPGERIGASIMAAVHAGIGGGGDRPRARRARHAPGHRSRSAPSASGACAKGALDHARGLPSPVRAPAARVGAHRHLRHPGRHLRRLPRAARAARHAGHADGNGPRRRVPGLRRRQVGQPHRRSSTC